MTLPVSFLRDGFTAQSPQRFRGILIGTEGAANSGKTEFCWTAPGPGIMLALDRQYRACLDNPEPPATRQPGQPPEGWAIQPIPAAMSGTVTQDAAIQLWREFYQKYYLKALNNMDARTVVLDGDSDSFEWQMIAECGRVIQVPQLMRTGLNASRRAMIAKAMDSGKIVLTTNKLKKKYEGVWDAAGNPVPDPQKPQEQKREWDGVSYERQGFNDHEYLYEIQLRHLYQRAHPNGNGKVIPQRWGIQILMCKANRSLEGEELWGPECDLPTLLQYVYPHISLEEWGY